MDDIIARIREPLRDDFARYEEFMRSVLHSESGLLGEVIDYILSSRGKGMRPMLVMLLAGIHSRTGLLSKRTHLAAMLVELVHTASLVHDDVVDSADTRHGQASVNFRWNPRVSVLAGDYILAQAFGAGMESGQMDMVTYIVTTVSSMAEGEFIQMEANEESGMTRELYLDIIYKKTATLLGVSSGVGAMSSGADSRGVAIAREIGVNLGMAFQIKDDILDYAPEEQTGKPCCADLREKKVNFPLLSILEKSDPLQKRLILGRVECVDREPEQIMHIRELVIKEGGLDVAGDLMHRYLDKARGYIADYPDSQYKESLQLLCDYVGVRDK